jgi:hypothetical protein
LRSIVAFLVINKIDELPIASIRSVLENSSAPIRVGYLNEQDIAGLNLSPRVEFIRLKPLPDINLKGAYKDFSDSLFYQIVQLKWQLIETLFELDYEFIIYTDLDVIWFSDPVASLEAVFAQDSKIALQIQSFTSDPSNPKLCMGFVAFRNAEATHKIVSECKDIHVESLKNESKYGDDDAVTKYFTENNMTDQIRLLPQSTFPVGSLLNLYATVPVFPGLAAPTPYIFHLNYVVGLQNKRIMMRLLKKRMSVKTVGLNHWQVLLILKRLRFISSKIKKKRFFN